MQPFDLKTIARRDNVLESYCVRLSDMKILNHCFPPKLRQDLWPEVSSKTL